MLIHDNGVQFSAAGRPRQYDGYDDTVPSAGYLVPRVDTEHRNRR